MFTSAEWALIVRGLDMSAASCKRLANREGQPPEVQAAYARSLKEISDLALKVQGEAHKAAQVKK